MEYIQKSLFGVLYEEEYIKNQKIEFSRLGGTSTPPPWCPDARGATPKQGVGALAPGLYFVLHGARLCFQSVFLHLKILFQAKLPFLDGILELENHNSFDFLSQSKQLQYAIDICRGYNFQEKKTKEKIHGELYQVYQAVVDSI